MLAEGFHPDFPPAVVQQVKTLQANPAAANGVNGARDLRSLLWSSIDNDTSRDLDQAEVAERVNGGIRVMIAVADVDSDVPLGSPADQHAASETPSVYTAVRTFPMLPEALSTNLTSLNESADRLAIVVDMLVGAMGRLHRRASIAQWYGIRRNSPITVWAPGWRAVRLRRRTRLRALMSGTISDFYIRISPFT
jgi:exoribonuclease-2